MKQSKKGKAKKKSNMTGTSAHPAAQQQQKSSATASPLSECAKEVQSYWDKLPLTHRRELLTFDLRLLHARAAYVQRQSEMTDALNRAVQRLSCDNSTWKKWQWEPESKLFDSADSFRHYITRERLPHSLCRCIAHTVDRLKPSSSWAKPALHTHMLGLAHKVAVHKQRQKERSQDKPWHLSRKSDAANLVLMNLLQEHEFLYNAFARPVAKSLASVLPAHIPKGDPPDAYTGSFVSFVVLDKAVKQKPASAKEIVDWVENQTAEFCQLSNIEGTNAEDSQLVPFALVQSPHGITLTLTEEWLQSLNSPGAHGSAVEPGRGSSDQFLSQVFDARPLFSAKPPLPGATGSNVTETYDQLISALEGLKAAEAELDKVESMLQTILEFRQQMAALNPGLIRREPGNPNQVLQPKVMLCLLRQEYNIAGARMLRCVYKSHVVAAKMFRLNQQLTQAEAEYGHLEMVQGAISRYAPPGPDSDQPVGTQTRAATTAALKADKAATQKSMVEICQVMLGLQDEQDAVEGEMQRSEPELAILKAWGEQIWDLMAAVEDIMKGLDVRAATPGPWMGFGLNQQQLTQLMPHFVQDIWPKLCTPELNEVVYKALQVQHEEMTRRFEQGYAVVHTLMRQVVEAACDDPAALLLPRLVYPLLRERLAAKVAAHKAGASLEASSNSCNTADWDPTVSEAVGKIKAQLQAVSLDGNTLELRQQLSSITSSNLAVRSQQYEWVYAAFVEDVCLQQSCSVQNPGPVCLEQPFEHTFLGAMDLNSAWLAVLFCSYM